MEMQEEDFVPVPFSSLYHQMFPVPNFFLLKQKKEKKAQAAKNDGANDTQYNGAMLSGVDAVTAGALVELVAEKVGVSSDDMKVSAVRRVQG